MNASLAAPAIAIQSVATNNAKTRASSSFSFGKYREIIIAVGFFLLFDLGVLILNFYTSFQIAEDAVGINLSGRQRMLSQRTAKALLAVEAAKAKGLPADKDFQELVSSVRLFDVSLKGFQKGATVPGGDGKPVRLQAAEGDKAADILRKAQDIWTPYQAKLAPVLDGASSDAELATAVDYARANNLKLLGLMNDLTTALEAVASNRANNLRLVQTGGIGLALLNFAFILLKFLRRLRSSDAAIEAANEENREILTSVREGLFLITPGFKLGSQLSRSASALFGTRLAPGDDFFSLLEPLLAGPVLADARDYVELLFAPHVKEALVQGINPLSEVEVAMKNRLGHSTMRHLSFHFNRVQEKGAVRHLLVTVQDISERIELQKKLQGERQRAQQEFAMLLRAFDADPALLRQFVERAEAGLLEVNDLLRGSPNQQGDLALLKNLEQAARRMHAFKGDASMFGLDTLTQQAHSFESELQRIKNSGIHGEALGNALLALPVALADLLTKVSSLKSLTGLRRDASAPEQDLAIALEPMLLQLASQVASYSGKQVQTLVHLAPLAGVSAQQQDLVREIAVQLVRNAVVHGIETAADRAAAQKPAQGTLGVDLSRSETDWCLTVRDDGAGLSAPRIRQRLLELGWYTALQLESFDDRQIVGHIFKPGFSTALGAASMHAGRGVGLDLVQANVQKLGAQLLLASTQGKFTEFKIRFPV